MMNLFSSSNFCFLVCLGVLFAFILSTITSDHAAFGNSISVDITSGAATKSSDAYQPNPISVGVGDKVAWTNHDNVVHTVTSGSGSTPDYIFGFDSARNPILIKPNSSFEYTFSSAGKFPYFCQLHPTMVGEVDATEVAPPSPSPPLPSVPNGYMDQPSYAGDCANRPQNSVCLGFSDGYLWLIFGDSVAESGKIVGSDNGKNIELVTGFSSRYYHILGTDYVKQEAINSSAPSPAPNPPPSSPSVPEISGKYIDSKNGLSIELPADWKGIKIFDAVAIVGPPGSKVASGNFGFDTADPAKSIDAAEMLIYTMPAQVGKLTLKQTFLPTSKSSSAMVSPSPASECKGVESDFTKINGVSVFHILNQCQIDKGQSGIPVSYKQVFYGAISDDRLAIISFVANSTSSFDRYLPEFQKSAETLKIEGSAGNIQTGFMKMLGMTAYKQPIKMEGNEGMQVAIDGMAPIQDLTADANSNSIYFKTQASTSEEDGVAIVHLQNILKGPYAVLVDGKSTGQYTVIDDKDQGGQMLLIGYGSGNTAHEISVSGTQIIPEFPTAALYIVAASFVPILMAGRLRRLMGGK